MAKDLSIEEIEFITGDTLTKEELKSDRFYKETQIPQRDISLKVPSKIVELRNQFGRHGFSRKSIKKNFYAQIKFMEDYEDDFRYKGYVPDNIYYPTYNDLNDAQLRDYFSWRTAIRKGHYQPANDLFCCIYLSELINGIGVDSVEESLEKMQEFYQRYFKLRYARYKINFPEIIQHWILEFGIVHRVDNIMLYIDDKALINRDRNINILKNPDAYSDKEIFDAMCAFGGDRTKSSTIVKQHPDTVIPLFAKVWRTGTANRSKNVKGLFSLCFGNISQHNWYPLSDILYCKKFDSSYSLFELNPCRKYSYSNGIWSLHCYLNIDSKNERCVELLHEADRLIRKYLGIGGTLRKRAEEDWATPYIEAALEEDRKAKIKAARKKIKIAFSELDKIRKDAGVTRDALLTEDEKEETDDVKKEEILGNFSAPTHDIALSEKQLQILKLLLCGESVKKLLKDWYEMAEIFADSLNEALFDRLGDNAVECDGSDLRLVEDYRDDIQEIVGL